MKAHNRDIALSSCTFNFSKIKTWTIRTYLKIELEKGYSAWAGA